MRRPLLRAAVAGTACAALALPAASPFAVAEDASSFQRRSTTPAYLNAGGPDALAVAEISTVSPDGRTLYVTDAGGGVVGRYDITDPSAPKPLGTIAVDGEPTSVYAVEGYVLVVVDSSDGDFKAPTGHVSVLDAATFDEVRRIELGGQPDSIDVAGGLAVIAMENQRDEDAKNDAGTGKKGDLPQAPAGELAFLTLDGDPSGWTLSTVSLSGLPGLVEASDPEPEYVKFSPDGSKVAVTLQENNAVVIVDAATHEVLHSWSAGEATVDGIDTAKDGQIVLDGSITAAREPDAIGWIDDDHVATANEGDWKGGTRGWSIFQADGTLVWDAGNTMEHLAISAGHWPDSRAAKKGIEPEGLAVATFGDTRYAFVGSERANFVAVYDVTDPANPVYSQMLPTTNGPEGILPIPGRDLLAISSEEDEPGSPMRATVALYELAAGAPQYPMIQSDIVDGAPIGWLALGALAASDEPGQLYTIPDVALTPNRILAVDATGTPARITSAIDVTLDGQPTGFDVEGLWAIPCGLGFWLGVEGNGAEGEEATANQLVQTDAEGRVLRTVPLPAEIVQHLGKWGVEGITGTPDGSTLYVALQRDLDKSAPTRILEYDVASDTFRTFLYELEHTSAQGDWMGLSEITFVASDDAGVRLGLIERDKGTGPEARVKHITEVTIAPDAVDGDTLDKQLVHDVLPELQATRGWTQEKLEGMTVDVSGNVYVSTDNDGLDDINGETVLLNLGRIFGDVNPGGQCEAPTPQPSTSAPRTPAPTALPTITWPGLPSTGN